MVRHLPFLFLASKGTSGECHVHFGEERLILRGHPGRRTSLGMVVWLGDFNVSRNTSRVPHPYTEEDAEMFIAGMGAQREGRRTPSRSCASPTACSWAVQACMRMPMALSWAIGWAFRSGARLCHRSGPAPDDVRLRGSGSADHPCRLVLRQSGFGHVLAGLGARHNGSQMRDCRARGMKILLP